MNSNYFPKLLNNINYFEQQTYKEFGLFDYHENKKMNNLNI